MSTSTAALGSLTEPFERLEDRGIAVWHQGDGLLDALSSARDGVVPPGPGDRADASEAVPAPTRALLCAADAASVLRVFPRAVVTASNARRLLLTTPTGPIDLLPIGTRPIEEALLGFGLSALAFAHRPSRDQWCDPCGGRKQFEQGELDVTTVFSRANGSANPFEDAPRRYWITARLISQYRLRPTHALLEQARTALPCVLDRLPQGAPARRELSRTLLSSNPAEGLGFLRQSGVSSALFPGVRRATESVVARLPARPALRWAAWLDGTAVQSAIVKLRMPHALSRSIERLHRAHPIDRTIESLRDGGSRKILQRLRRDEIAGLIEWRRLELEVAPQNEETRLRSKRLDEVEAQLAEMRRQQERTAQIGALAIDGKTVMRVLDAGPGPHVGRALAYLADHIGQHPEANETDNLISLLRAWADFQPDITDRGRTGRD